MTTLRRALLIVAVAATLNAIVAVACALFSPLTAVEDDDRIALTPEIEWWWDHAPDRWLRSAPIYEVADGRGVRKITIHVPRDDDAPPDVAVMVSAGWPRPILIGAELEADFGVGPPTFVAALDTGPAFRARLIPYHARWRNAAFNTALYAVVVSVVLVPAFIRRSLRRRQRRCPDCGYPAGSSATCSECGHAVCAAT